MYKCKIVYKVFIFLSLSLVCFGGRLDNSRLCGPILSPVVNGTFDSDSDWTKGLGWSIDAVGVKKALYAHNAGFGTLEPSATLDIRPGRVYMVSFTTSGSGGIYLLTVSCGGTQVKQVVADGSYSESVVAATSGNLQFDITSSNAGAVFALDDVAITSLPISGRLVGRL